MTERTTKWVVAAGMLFVMAGIGLVALLWRPSRTVSKAGAEGMTTSQLKDREQELYYQYEEARNELLNSGNSRQADAARNRMNRVEREYLKVRGELARRGVTYKDRKFYQAQKVPGDEPP